MKKTPQLTFLALAISLQSLAQSTSEKEPAVQFSGYAELYYSFDGNKPADHNKPAFVYNHNRHNEVNLNLGFLKAAYASNNVRANVAIMAGTYANTNLAAEPGVLKNILEANAGVKISKQKNLWIDAGIFASHIGFESAIGKDCWNLTRSMVAENSPYYASGVKITYNSPNEQWLLSGLLLNGWQRIQRVNGNSLPSFGTQLQYKPANGALFNYSTFIGTDKPDSNRLMRYYQNIYGIFNAGKKAQFTLGLDVGFEQREKDKSAVNTWFSPIALCRFTTSAKTALTLRTEYYQDEKGVIIGTGTPNGFKTWGFSANFDLNISTKAVWRLEAKQYTSKDEVFQKNNNQFVTGNTSFTTALAVSF
jgi:hypothetical protein